MSGGGPLSATAQPPLSEGVAPAPVTAGPWEHAPHSQAKLDAMSVFLQVHKNINSSIYVGKQMAGGGGRSNERLRDAKILCRCRA